MDIIGSSRNVVVFFHLFFSMWVFTRGTRDFVKRFIKYK